MVFMPEKKELYMSWGNIVFKAFKEFIPGSL
jgi:hypothetical protein